MRPYDDPEDDEDSSAPTAPLPDFLRDTEAEVTRRAVEVIGNEREAMRWLGTPIRALNYATPISLLYDLAGRNAVLAVLGRLEYGVL
jgi:uncharacterized protein (DUF2384 family)